MADSDSHARAGGRGQLDMGAVLKVVNEARFGYNRLYQPTYNGDHTVNPQTAYGLNTGVATTPLTGGLPRIGFFGEFQTIGGFKWPKVQGPDTRFQFVDHVSFTNGAHTIKFGVEIHHDSVQRGRVRQCQGQHQLRRRWGFCDLDRIGRFLGGSPDERVGVGRQSDKRQS